MINVHIHMIFITSPENIYMHDDGDMWQSHDTAMWYCTWHLHILQLSKFLGVMESRGLIQVVEQSQGVQTITDISFKHPLYVCQRSQHSSAIANGLWALGVTYGYPCPHTFPYVLVYCKWSKTKAWERGSPMTVDTRCFEINPNHKIACNKMV